MAGKGIVRPSPLWKVSVATSPQAEEAVSELLEARFGQPAISYTEIEPGTTEVTVYLSPSELGRKSQESGRPHPAAPFTPWLSLGRMGRRNRRSAQQADQASPTMGWGRGGGTENTRKKGLRSRRTVGRGGISRQALGQVRAGLARIRRCGLDTGRASISVRKLRREDWADSWKRHFKPVVIARALMLRPSWSRRKAGKGQAEVVLDPSLSFGTGQHATTAFCLRQVVRHRPKPGERRSLLDIGTGSGILAVAATKLGFAPVEAFDSDSEAVRVAQANAALNGVAETVRVEQGSLAEVLAGQWGSSQAPFVVANILANVIVDFFEQGLARAVTPGGWLVLSGILRAQTPDIRARLQWDGLELLAQEQQEDWVCLIARRGA